MHLSGTYTDGGIDWSVKNPLHGAVANMLVLRGHRAQEAVVQPFQDMSLYVHSFVPTLNPLVTIHPSIPTQRPLVGRRWRRVLT